LIKGDGVAELGFSSMHQEANSVKNSEVPSLASEIAESLFTQTTVSTIEIANASKEFSKDEPSTVALSDAKESNV
jgi:hypothetical protein